MKFDPRHWEALASGLADSGSRVERLQLVEVPNYFFFVGMIFFVIVTNRIPYIVIIIAIVVQRRQIIEVCHCYCYEEFPIR